MPLSSEISNVATEAKKGKTAISALAGTIGQLEITAGAAIGTITALSAAIGAAGVGAAFAASVSRAANFDEALRGVAKTADLSQQEVDVLTERLLEVAQTTPKTRKELAQIAEEAGRLGVRGTENIAKFTDTVQKIATATDLTASQAAKELAKIATATGQPVSAIGTLADQINRLSNTTAASASEISRSFRKLAPGISSQVTATNEALSALAATLVESGQEPARAGTRMRRVLEQLAEPDTMRQMAQVLGQSVATIQTRLQQDALPVLLEFLDAIKDTGREGAVLSEIFTSAARGAINQLTSNVDDLRDNLDKARNAQGSVNREFNVAIDTFNKQADILKNNLGAIITSIGKEALPQMTEAMKFAVDQIQKIDEEDVKVWGRLASNIADLASSVLELGTSAARRAFEGLTATLDVFLENEELPEEMLSASKAFQNFKEATADKFTAPSGQETFRFPTGEQEAFEDAEDIARNFFQKVPKDLRMQFVEDLTQVIREATERGLNPKKLKTAMIKLKEDFREKYAAAFKEGTEDGIDETVKKDKKKFENIFQAFKDAEGRVFGTPGPRDDRIRGIGPGSVPRLDQETRAALSRLNQPENLLRLRREEQLRLQPSRNVPFNAPAAGVGRLQGPEGFEGRRIGLQALKESNEELIQQRKEAVRASVQFSEMASRVNEIKEEFGSMEEFVSRLPKELRKTVETTDEFQDAAQSLGRMIDEGPISAEKFQRLFQSMKKVRPAVAEAIKELIRFRKEGEDTFRSLRDVGIDFTKSLSRAFGRFVTEGTFGFKKLARSFLQDFFNVVTSRLITNPILNQVFGTDKASGFKRGSIGASVVSGINAFFNDTPGVVRARQGGAVAGFAPGDFVAASRTREGLRQQVQGQGKVVVQMNNKFEMGGSNQSVRQQLQQVLPKFKRDVINSINAATERNTAQAKVIRSA